MKNLLAQYGLLVLILAQFAACTHERRPDQGPFEFAKYLGSNKNKHLEEPSGLVASSTFPGMIWAHNDSGNPADLFLLDSTCKTVRTFHLKGIKNRDWEDITRGPGPEKGVSYLYVGDIGDNYARFPYKLIYRFPEPVSESPETITDIDTLVVTLPDGKRDSEAIMMDPISGHLYLFSKREESIGIYEVKAPIEKDSVLAEKVGTLPYTQIVAADMSVDGREILVKNYDRIYYWQRADSVTVPTALRAAATELNYEPEPQGEAIAWALDTRGFYTISENSNGQRGRLLYYRRK